MAFFADHDHGGHGGVGIEKGMAQLQTLNHGGKSGIELTQADFTGKLHPHEKQAGVRIAVLRGLFNVGLLFQQKSRHSMDDAGAVRTR
jgi:hypothetical protein